jgi:peptide/nickel transport system permease protein
VATEPVTELSADALGEVARREGLKGRGRGEGQGPWQIAYRRLLRNRVALGFGALFLVIVVVCLAAPLWAASVAHTGPIKNHLTDKIVVDGEEKDVVAPDGVPIGPTYGGRFFLGADSNGRDIAVRLLYGGRNSLLIGVAAALITALLSTIVGMLAGYFRGWTDAVISRTLDVIWAYPVILLGVALGTALSLGGLQVGPVDVSGDSKLIPVVIIAVVYVPYMARPLRGQVLALREKEFVEAAEAQGSSPFRIIVSEVLPNLWSTIIVFLPLMIANAILLEAALSFVGAGIRPPEPSWGTMISDGVKSIITAPHLAIVPGVMLVLTVLALNVFGDGVRDALDPRAKIRVEH